MIKKKKFDVYVGIDASFFLGTFEAETKEEAERIAYDDENCATPGLCHQCSRDIELGDVAKLFIEEKED